MGLVINTSILIAHARQRRSIDDLVKELGRLHSGQSLTASVMTVAELTHGVFRGSRQHVAMARQVFVDDLCREVAVRPVTLPFARLIDKIEGRQESVGTSIDLPDLIIGATAIHHGDAVLTLNPRHFNLVPGLVVQAL